VTERVTITCPKCLLPVNVRMRLRKMASGEIEADRTDAKRGMVIHMTKGCVAR
jgi:hypothetical protein